MNIMDVPECRYLAGRNLHYIIVRDEFRWLPSPSDLRSLVRVRVRVTVELRSDHFHDDSFQPRTRVLVPLASMACQPPPPRPQPFWAVMQTAILRSKGYHSFA